MTRALNVPDPQDRTTVLRLAFLGGLAVLLLAALLARLWFLQVLAGDRFAALADSTRLRTVVSAAPRGHVLASDGRELVRNRPALALVADRQRLVDDAGRPRDDESERVVGRLAVLLGLEVDDVLGRINDRRYSPFRPVPVAIDVPEEVLLSVRQNQELFRGIGRTPSRSASTRRGTSRRTSSGTSGRSVGRSSRTPPSPSTGAATWSVAAGWSRRTSRTCGAAAASRCWS